MTLLRAPEDMQYFVPDSTNERTLRDAFGRFATGITIVTVASDLGPIANTANSFTTVSLAPPLILWAVQKTSRRAPYFTGAENFAVHVLGADQEDLCWSVAKDMSALSSLDVIENADGVPLIEGCLARYECRQHALHDGGDHDIIVGKVLRAAFAKEADGLCFFNGKMNRASAS